MAAHPRMRETLARALIDGMPVGAGAARLLRGNHPVIAECEARMAAWIGAEKTLLTSSGYQANYLLLSTLPQRGDIVLYDANVHACIRDGIRASAAKSFKFAHNDVSDLRRLISRVIPGEVREHEDPGSRDNEESQSSWDPGSRLRLGRDDKQIFIVTESLFSMDGDFAPLAELLEIAKQNNAMLVVDEAHATGIYGASGRGCCENLPRDNLITVHTGGKAFGAAGGMIAARADIIDLLINTARPFIFATAPMPVLALALITATEILEDEPWRRERLLELCAYARDSLQEVSGKKQDTENNNLASCILPLVIGSDEAATATAKRLQVAGFDVRAVRPPTVPVGTARLRISINIGVSEEDIGRLVQAIRGVAGHS